MRTFHVEREAPVRADAPGMFVRASDAPGAEVGDRIVVRGHDGGTERTGTVASIDGTGDDAHLRVDLDA
jgi:hypothetical protein